MALYLAPGYSGSCLPFGHAGSVGFGEVCFGWVWVAYISPAEVLYRGTRFDGLGC